MESTDIASEINAETSVFCHGQEGEYIPQIEYLVTKYEQKKNIAARKNFSRDFCILFINSLRDSDKLNRFLFGLSYIEHIYGGSLPYAEIIMQEFQRTYQSTWLTDGMIPNYIIIQLSEISPSTHVLSELTARILYDYFFQSKFELSLERHIEIRSEMLKRLLDGRIEDLRSIFEILIAHHHLGEDMQLDVYTTYRELFLGFNGIHPIQIVNEMAHWIDVSMYECAISLGDKSFDRFIDIIRQVSPITREELMALSPDELKQYALRIIHDRDDMTPGILVSEDVIADILSIRWQREEVDVHVTIAWSLFHIGDTELSSRFEEALGIKMEVIGKMIKDGEVDALTDQAQREVAGIISQGSELESLTRQILARKLEGEGVFVVHAVVNHKYEALSFMSQPGTRLGVDAIGHTDVRVEMAELYRRVNMDRKHPLVGEIEIVDMIRWLDFTMSKEIPWLDLMFIYHLQSRRLEQHMQDSFKFTVSGKGERILFPEENKLAQRIGLRYVDYAISPRAFATTVTLKLDQALLRLVVDHDYQIYTRGQRTIAESISPSNRLDVKLKGMEQEQIFLQLLILGGLHKIITGAFMDSRSRARSRTGSSPITANTSLARTVHRKGTMRNLPTGKSFTENQYEHALMFGVDLVTFNRHRGTLWTEKVIVGDELVTITKGSHTFVSPIVPEIDGEHRNPIVWEVK